MRIAPQPRGAAQPRQQTEPVHNSRPKLRRAQSSFTCHYYGAARVRLCFPQITITPKPEDANTRVFPDLQTTCSRQRANALAFSNILFHDKAFSAQTFLMCLNEFHTVRMFFSIEKNAFISCLFRHWTTTANLLS